ncbi:MAG: cysteine hydrolase [Rhodospirillaceae bacterium]|jgi:nicotinamidase-related amidase|nr:cysteine hydrolase [Rhodospirillaceae bacterium]
MAAQLTLPAPTALILVDLQRAIDDPRWAAEGPRNNPQAEAAAAALLGDWRRIGWPIIHVRHDSTEPDSTYRPGQPGNDFKPGTAPRSGETIIAKRVNSAFIGTDLDRHLRDTGQSRLVILGIITNNSLEATVRNAANLGYAVLVPEDCCFTFAKRDLNGRLWPAEDVHALSLANLHGEYATICTSAAIRAALPR